jgi:hypothetical protein
MDELEPPGSPWIPQMPAQIDPSAMAMFQAEHNRQMAAAQEEHERRISEVEAANEQRLNVMQADHNRQMAELRSLLAQQQQQARQYTPTPIPSPAMPAAAQRSNRLNPDYNQKHQLKAIALTAFEGELDHKLVVTFIQKVRLAGTVMRLRPTVSAADSNSLIEYAAGWFSDEPMNWLQLVVLEDDYSTTYDDARNDGFPFTFDEFADMIVHRFSPTGATEDLWTELEKMQRKKYATAYAFHRAFLGIAKMLGVYRQTEQKGGRAFDLYVKKLTAREETIYQSMMATLHRERKIMYLNDLMTIVENAKSNRPNLPSTSGPTPMELDAVSVRGRGRGRTGPGPREVLQVRRIWPSFLPVRHSRRVQAWWRPAWPRSWTWRIWRIWWPR